MFRSKLICRGWLLCKCKHGIIGAFFRFINSLGKISRLFNLLAFAADGCQIKFVDKNGANTALSHYGINAAGILYRFRRDTQNLEQFKQVFLKQVEKESYFLNPANKELVGQRSR